MEKKCVRTYFKLFHLTSGKAKKDIKQSDLKTSKNSIPDF